MVSGIMLVLIGVIGYVYGLIVNNASFTALIPASFGLVLFILGFAASRNEDLRKHLMHVAVIIGLLGFIIPFVRLVSKMGELSFSAAFLSQVAMAAVCLAFVVSSIRSFIAARRNRIDRN